MYTYIYISCRLISRRRTLSCLLLDSLANGLMLFTQLKTKFDLILSNRGHNTNFLWVCTLNILLAHQPFRITNTVPT